MDGYTMGTAIKTDEEEEEGNEEGNCKQPETNPVGGSQGWAKESAARARSERAGNLAGYATRIENELKEDEEEENTAGNHKKPIRNPVRGSHG